MSDETPQWSDEVVAENFRAEVRARFEAHNAAYRAKETVEFEQIFRDHPERRGEPGFEVRDSGAWGFYQACEIRIERNTVTIVSPGDAIDLDVVHMFDNTTMAGSKPWVKAAIVDGEPRVTIEIVLVATWDDSLDAAWKKDGNDKRQVLVELDEDEVLMFLGVLERRADALAVPAIARRVRELAQVHLSTPLGWTVARNDPASVEQMHKRTIEAQHLAEAALELLGAVEKAQGSADPELRKSLPDRLKIALEYLP